MRRDIPRGVVLPRVPRRQSAARAGSRRARHPRRTTPRVSAAPCARRPSRGGATRACEQCAARAPRRQRQGGTLCFSRHDEAPSRNSVIERGSRSRLHWAQQPKIGRVVSTCTPVPRFAINEDSRARSRRFGRRHARPPALSARRMAPPKTVTTARFPGAPAAPARGRGGAQASPPARGGGAAPAAGGRGNRGSSDGTLKSPSEPRPRCSVALLTRHLEEEGLAERLRASGAPVASLPSADAPHFCCDAPASDGAAPPAFVARHPKAHVDDPALDGVDQTVRALVDAGAPLDAAKAAVVRRSRRRRRRRRPPVLPSVLRTPRARGS